MTDYKYRVKLTDEDYEIVTWAIYRKRYEVQEMLDKGECENPQGCRETLEKLKHASARFVMPEEIQ